MLLTIVTVLLPVMFIVGLGWAAGKAHAFPADAVAVISELALDFALPAGLFLSTVTVTREALIAQAPLLAGLAIVVMAIWVAVLLAGLYLFGHDLKAASLQALLIALAAIPLYGLAVVTGVLGSKAEVSVPIGSVVVNLLPVPATMIALSLGGGGKNGGTAKPGRAIGKALWSTIKTPYIVAPIVGVVLVLVGVRLPQPIIATVKLLGPASSGIGLFVAGLTLSTVKLKLTPETGFNVLAKLVAMPALFLGVALLLHAKADIVKKDLILSALPAARSRCCWERGTNPIRNRRRRRSR